MTATLDTTAHPSTPLSAVAPSTRFRRRALGVAVVAGSVLSAAGFVAPAFLGTGRVANVLPSAVAIAAVGFVGVRALRMSDREYATSIPA